MLGSAFLLSHLSGGVETESAGDENNIVTIAAEDVTLRVIQWDIDGHTDYPEGPKAIYLDSARQTTGRIVFDSIGKESAHFDTNGRVYFDEFQFKLPAWR